MEGNFDWVPGKSAFFQPWRLAITVLTILSKDFKRKKKKDIMV